MIRQIVKEDYLCPEKVIARRLSIKLESKMYTKNGFKSPLLFAHISLNIEFFESSHHIGYNIFLFVIPKFSIQY